MKFKYDAEVDAGYVIVSRAEPAARTRSISAGNRVVNLDFDSCGNLVGVEIV